jgi:hypothetical protein
MRVYHGKTDRKKDGMASMPTDGVGGVQAKDESSRGGPSHQNHHRE